MHRIVSIWLAFTLCFCVVCDRALLESQVDAGLRDEAGKTAHSVVHLARKKLPQRLPDVLRLCVFHGVSEGKAAEKEMKSVPEFSAISKLYKLKQ